MKKIISILALVLALTMVMSVAAFAAPVFSTTAETPIDGITDIQFGADRIDVTAAATSGADYSILLVKGDSLPTVDSDIAYINQANATSTSVDFDVLPLIANCDEEMMLYIGSNATDFDLIEIPVAYAEPAPTNDYITSADTSKGKIATDVTSVTQVNMGAVAGNAIVSLALDTTAYPNAGADTAGYVVGVVDANGDPVSGATVLYSAERKKYIAVIPSTTTDYKFEILTEGTANDVIVKYADFTGDKLINLFDYMQFAPIYKGTTSATVKNALIADLTGDGLVNLFDYMPFAAAYKGQTYTFGVLSK